MPSNQDVKQRILVIEDDEDINELIIFNLESANYVAVGKFSGIDGINYVDQFKPDLILLDIMLPDIDGFEVCRRLKSDKLTQNIPIIMLTAKSEDSDIILGLELGADDYIPKPFSFGVLMARIRTQLRKSLQPKPAQESQYGKISAAGLTIDEQRRQVTTSEGEVLLLTVSEFEILKLLASKPGWVFSRTMIIDNVKGDDYPVTDRSVDVQIVSLRKKLKERSSIIETVRGVGYKLSEK